MESSSIPDSYPIEINLLSQSTSHSQDEIENIHEEDEVQETLQQENTEIENTEEQTDNQHKLLIEEGKDESVRERKPCVHCDGCKH